MPPVRRQGAKLVDHQCHVRVADPELAQQHVERFGFGNKHRRAQPVFQTEIAATDRAQQILGQHNATDIVFILANHRQTGVARVDDLADRLRQRLPLRDGLHLLARHHDVAHRHFGDGDGALDNGQCFGIDQVALVRPVQELQQFTAIIRFAQQ